MYDFASITSAHEGAVEDLAFDANHQRIASVGNGCLIIWGVDQNGEYVFYFTHFVFNQICRYLIQTWDVN
jgi:hypothetical protein